ncbi:MAG TPA: hypothetical protein VFR18_05505 [Terriglobia bacterium]|nr:hypothetical protein [Terriglobia bacterium]
MKGEHTAALEAVDAQPDPRATTESAPQRSRANKQRSKRRTLSSGAVRLFLSKADSNGVPSLDRELSSESEAIVESLKTGKSYFVISEWKGLADLTKKVPLIRKEAVTQKQHSE